MSASKLKGTNNMLKSHTSIIYHLWSTIIGIKNNTFLWRFVAMSDYEMKVHAHELICLCAAGERGVRRIDSKGTHPKPRFVEGALGPTNRTGNISPSVDPSDRNVAFGELVDTHIWSRLRGC